MPRFSLRWWGAGVCALAALALDAAPAWATAHVRVNQVGYAPAAGKRAFLMSSEPEAGAVFQVRNAADDHVVFSAPVGARVASWSSRFPNVYVLDFGTVRAEGTYRIVVRGPLDASSPRFRVERDATLLPGLIANSLFFFRTQRDGPDVIRSVMDRRPSHLNDRRAAAYDRPVYEDGVLVGDLAPVGGTLDGSGGWFDAGDYVKFVQTHSYALTLLLMGVRDFPRQMGARAGAARDFTAEARFGLEWLARMWDDESRTLYYQVGIGDGDGCEAICGDHDIWRLPQEDDDWAGDDPAFRYVRHRPALRSGPPGSKISPNLAGRLAAAFALGFQVYKDRDRRFADECLRAAQHIYALADTAPQGELLSVSPHDFYPEETWQDDLELGAAELAHAVGGGDLPSGLPHSDPRFYLRQAAHWARAWIQSDFDASDSLNLYDTSSLAHYELHRALTRLGTPSGLEVTKAQLLADMKAELDNAVEQARQDPFGSGFALNQFDGTSHLVGLALSSSLYDELTGSDAFSTFGRRQLGIVFGTNAWGVSFIVGAGTTFAHCMQHQVANLSGTLDGTPPVVRGAAVNGPNNVAEFEGSGEVPEGARACPADGRDTFSRFTGHEARFRDHVGAWMSVEPAIDFTSSVPLTLARYAAGRD
ncbi:MAG TPA: glycoside hydrolase family 9 protein [Vicinamibacteria bacterium]